MKLILVTGANKGIGLAIVKRLLAEYADTRLLLGSRDSGRGEEAVKEVLASLGPQYTSRLEMLQLDVTSEQSVAAAVEKVRSRYGGEQPLYGLVNNAGGSLATDRETIQLNTYAVIRVCEAFLPLIQQRGGLLFVILLSRFFKNFTSSRQDSPDILRLGAQLRVQAEPGAAGHDGGRDGHLR